VLRSDSTRQPALTEFRGGTENNIGGSGGGGAFPPGFDRSLPIMPAGQLFVAPQVPTENDTPQPQADTPPATETTPSVPFIPSQPTPAVPAN